MLVTDVYYGFTDIALMKYKVGNCNVAVYYSATNNGDELAPVKKPPCFINAVNSLLKLFWGENCIHLSFFLL